MYTDSYVTFQMAEVLVSKRLFQEILERIHRSIFILSHSPFPNLILSPFYILSYISNNTIGGFNSQA